MRNFDRRIYQGTVEFVFDDNDNVTQFENRAVFVPEERRLYTEFLGRDKIRTDKNHRICFKSEAMGAPLLSLGRYMGRAHILPGDRNAEYNLEDFLVCTDDDMTLELSKEGVKNIRIILRGVHGKRKSVVSKEAVELQDYGRSMLLGQEEYSDMKIFEGAKCKYNFSENKITNLFYIDIELNDQIKLEDFNLVTQALELYWNFFEPNSNLEIDGIYLGAKDRNMAELELYKEKLPRARGDIGGRHHLIVNEFKIKMKEFHNILATFLNKDDKHARKITYGFSRYLDFLGYRWNDIDDGITLLAFSLDSICTELVKKEIDEEPAKENIKNIQDMIRKMDDIIDPVREFYCDSDIKAVLGAMSRLSQKEAIRGACEKFGIKYTDNLKDTVKRFIKARQQIVHGEDYDTTSMLFNLIGKDIVDEQITEDGKKTYIFGREPGDFSIISKLISDIGVAYFSGG